MREAFDRPNTQIISDNMNLNDLLAIVLDLVVSCILNSDVRNHVIERAWGCF